jgi:hypothetical protein
MPGEESAPWDDAACKARLADRQSRIRGRCWMCAALRAHFYR